MSDLVKRLRAAATHPYNQHGPHEFLTEAADRIAQLEAELDLARRGAAVEAALPAGPISQAQYNEALLTVSRLTEALRVVRDLNKSAEGWTYSQEIEDEIAETLPPPPSGEPMKLKIDEAKFLAAVDREGDYECGAGKFTNDKRAHSAFANSENASKGEQRTICEACGNSNLAHDRAAWTDDGTSYCPSCLPSPPSGSRAMSDLVERLRAYNPPDRTIDEQRQIAVDIHEAADRLAQLEVALREINQQRYTGRNTINLDNAYEMAIAINAKLLAVMDTARAAVEDKP